MKTITKIFSLPALLLPILASAGDWTAEQQEVLAFETPCISTQSVDEFMGCFHKDFVGWGTGSVPTTKADRMSLAADSFAGATNQLILFKPLSVIVRGNWAVVTYITTGKSTDKATGEVSYSTERWTDVCLKENGKWTWISDHGETVSED